MRRTNTGLVTPPSSGGPLSVTDGTTTVNPATSIVLPAGTLTNLGIGVGGVGMVVQQIGPIRVTYDTTDIGSNTGALLYLLPVNAIILGAWCVLREAWLDALSQMTSAIGALTIGDASGNNKLIRYDLWGSSVYLDTDSYALSADIHPPGAFDQFTLPYSAIVQTTGQSLGITVTADKVPIVGITDVYAIIATT